VLHGELNQYDLKSHFKMVPGLGFLATCLKGSNIISQYTCILTNNAHELTPYRFGFKCDTNKQNKKIFSVEPRFEPGSLGWTKDALANSATLSHYHCLLSVECQQSRIKNLKFCLSCDEMSTHIHSVTAPPILTRAILCTCTEISIQGKGIYRLGILQSATKMPVSARNNNLC
jgi:hypothetical protein